MALVRGWRSASRATGRRCPSWTTPPATRKCPPGFSAHILDETTPTETVNYFYGHDCAGSGLPVGEQRDDEWMYYLHYAEGDDRQGADPA